jgi:hypothetical protein
LIILIIYELQFDEKKRVRGSLKNWPDNPDQCMEDSSKDKEFRSKIVVEE